MEPISQSEQKRLVGETAIERLVKSGKIFSGMKIGLGTGSTVMPAVKRLAKYIQEGFLKDIRAVSTSYQTTVACEELGIPLANLSSKDVNGHLDLAIDGADEISPESYLIKGGGAALLLEKIVAYNATSFVVVADESKLVKTLGTGFMLPVEIIPEARASIILKLKEMGAKCILREGVKKAGPVVTDKGNHILDLHWESPVNPKELEIAINKIVGVVENGFFTMKKPTIFVADKAGIVKEI